MFKVTPLLSDCLSYPDLRFLNHWDTEERKWEQVEVQEGNKDALGGSKSSTSRAVVAHAFNPSTWEAQAGGSL